MHVCLCASARRRDRTVFATAGAVSATIGGASATIGGISVTIGGASVGEVSGATVAYGSIDAAGNATAVVV